MTPPRTEEEQTAIHFLHNHDIIPLAEPPHERALITELATLLRRAKAAGMREAAYILVREQMPNANYWWERLMRQAEALEAAG